MSSIPGHSEEGLKRTTKQNAGNMQRRVLIGTGGVLAALAVLLASWKIRAKKTANALQRTPDSRPSSDAPEVRRR